MAEKRTYNGLPDFMTKVAKEELNKLSEDIKECTVMYLPQVRASPPLKTGNDWGRSAVWVKRRDGYTMSEPLGSP